MLRHLCLTIVPLITFLPTLRGQDNYEVQVYPSATMKPGRTMTELHSNFTLSGSRQTFDGVLGTRHQVHETQGITDWSETGFYGGLVTTSGRASGFRTRS
jgi:hypothetical protein